MKSDIKYIELFSGIGAFSQAINKVFKGKAIECVYAADINEKCAEIFKKNYQMDSLNDLTNEKDKENIPEHNFCFFSPPCQAFSKSGHQRGFEDARGTLIYEVFKILDKYKPKYILMENVRNLVSHNKGETWKTITRSLRELGYKIPNKPLIISPHYFGYPQTRDRAFIPGVYDPKHSSEDLEFDLGNYLKKDDCSVYDVFDHNESSKELFLNDLENMVLDAWDEFYKGIDQKVIGFPIWADYFFNQSENINYPHWKNDFIRKNKNLYNRNKEFIDKWILKYSIFEKFTPTQRKFEWQAGTKIKSINEGIIQFRPSGVRVKAPTTAPALVAIVQVPIWGKYRRRFSVKECARLQGFPDDFDFGKQTAHECYKQLGNSINCDVLGKIVEKLLSTY